MRKFQQGLASFRSLLFVTVVTTAFTTVALAPISAFSIGAQPMAQTSASPAATSGANEPATQEALRKTQESLTNPAARNEILKGDTKAQAQDAKVRQMLGNNTEGAYKLSSEVLEKIVVEAGGDATKMQTIVNQLMSNPQSLEKYLTPAQRDEIRRMATDIEKKKGSAPASGSGL